MEVKLTDFGWSCAVATTGLRTTKCGTVSYMAPEQAGKSGYTMKAETWACSLLFSFCRRRRSSLRTHRGNHGRARRCVLSDRISDSGKEGHPRAV